MSQRPAQAAVRDLTGAELRSYGEHGWVALKGLVSSVATDALLARAKELIRQAEAARANGDDGPPDFWFSWSNSVFEARYMAAGPFIDIARSAELGRVASRLINTARPRGNPAAIRSLGGNLFCKMGGDSRWGGEIPFHQDGPSFEVHASGFATIWIALEDVEPDQGTMRFLDGSHRVGSLASHRSGPPLERHPQLLEDHAPTEPLHYAAGDATAHDGFTLHGSPANRTDRPRWGYACLYVAADLAFDDSAYHDRPHGFRAPLERYPIVYDERATT